MSLAERLVKVYFNLVYNPVYDFTTARLNRYRELQDKCVGKFQFKDGDLVLCVGLGTGNEISRILETNGNANIVGVDYSELALRKAQRKAAKLGKEVKLLAMDARHLEFPAESFHKVLCVHVMDFVGEHRQVTDEILRVLKRGGQFVITYPSDKEGAKLGCNLIRDIISNSSGSGKRSIKALLEVAARIVVGVLYVPLVFRPKKRFYSRTELTSMLAELAVGDLQIDEEPVYQDFIVSGTKRTAGGDLHAT